MNIQDLKILILDDDDRIREELSEFLTRKRSKVYSAGYPSRAISILRSHHIDLLFLDFALPEMDGIMFLRKVHTLYPKLKVIMISGTGRNDLAEMAVKNGATEFLRKPFLHREVQKAVTNIKK